MLAIPKWAKIQKVQRGTNRIVIPLLDDNILVDIDSDPTSSPDVDYETVELKFDGKSRHEGYSSKLSVYYFWELQ